MDCRFAASLRSKLAPLEIERALKQSPAGEKMRLALSRLYTLNDDPHPHDFVEFGLMKLKPCRISVSS
jgi:hypothetical protein